MASNYVVVTATGLLRTLSPTGTRIADGETLVLLNGVTDCRTQRYDNGALRAATAQEIADYDAAQVVAYTEAAQVTSRQRDILATIAWGIRGRNVAAWNALTLAQKKSTVLAEADTWRDLRVWIDQNL
jgi:hypothetical protein